MILHSGPFSQTLFNTKSNFHKVAVGDLSLPNRSTSLLGKHMADSTLKCNGVMTRVYLLHKNLVWCFESEAFSWSVI